MSRANWKKIQRHVGASADGIPGPQTASAILRKLNLTRAPVLPMVTGEGDRIKEIFIHCSATREGQDISADTIARWHKNQGWSDIGYHFVIGLDGKIEKGRSEALDGAHVRGRNDRSIAICYIGGLSKSGRSKDTRTDAQKASMKLLVQSLLEVYPSSQVLGHRDASPDRNGDGKIDSSEWLKDCPCFDVEKWWESVS